MAKKHRQTKPQSKPTPPPHTYPIDLNQQLYHRLAILTLFLLPLVFFGRFLFGTVMMFGTDFIGAGGYASRHTSAGI